MSIESPQTHSSNELPEQPEVLPAAPDTAAELATKPEVEKKADKKRFSTKSKLLAGLAGGALLAGGGVALGVGLNNQAPEKQEPVATAPAEPGETEAPEPTVEPTPDEEAPQAPERYDFGLSKADIQPFLDESAEAFASRPIEERVLLSLYYAQDLPKFASDYQKASKNPLDTVPVTIDETNTPEEIYALSAMVTRMRYTIPGPDNFSLDPELLDKLTVAGLVDGRSSTLYNVRARSNDSFIEFGGAAPSARSLAASKYLLLGTINSTSETYVNNEGLTCIDMNVTEQNGASNSSFKTNDSTTCLIKTDHGNLWLYK